VELLSNLVWLAVVMSLWGLWIATWRRDYRVALLPRIGLQLVALGVLTAVLLPAISITDDLQAGHNPAEVERTSVARNERQLSAVPPQNVLPFALALLILCVARGDSRSMALFTEYKSAPRPIQGHLRSLWSRPPPAV
jgi:hypothetical protein